MSKRQNKLKKLIILGFQLVKQRGISRYSSKFSKKTFTQHQFLVMGILKTELKMNYRDFRDWLEFSTEAVYLLKLKKIPHFTTLQKFLQRFDPVVFDILISSIFSQIVRNKLIDIAVDSSGFTSSYSSKYYVMRINRETTYRNFMKTSILVDPKTKALIAVKCRKGPAHDTKDFIPLLRKANRNIKQRIRNVIADKAYDSSKNFYFIEKELHANAVIPLRYYRTRRAGRHTIRKHRPLDPDKTVYGRRNMAETVFSAIKRKFGGDLQSRLIEVKKKEIKMKALVYNLCILMTKKSYFIFIGFLQSP
ncbi:MAG: IS5 family transposase [Candidatus Micrarchaeia archaeon]